MPVAAVCAWCAVALTCTCLLRRASRYRERLEKSPLCGWVSPVVYHADTPMGYATSRDDPNVTWVSVYFFGPDRELLEIAAQTQEFAADVATENVVHIPQAALHKDYRIAMSGKARALLAATQEKE